MKTPLKTVAVFDFDGTITNLDTFRDFLIFSFGAIKFYLAFISTAPLIALYLLGLVKNDYPKSALFKIFFKGCSVNKYHMFCSDYATNRLPQLIRADALERIKWHKKNNHTIIINSASLADWIKPWADVEKFDYIIATQTEISNGKLTGSFIGPCPYGPEKVLRLKQLNITKNNSYIYAYGDSNGDKAMLDMADVPAFRSFN